MTATLFLIAGIVLFVGMLIGSIGIGGTFLVPALTHLGGMEIHLAIASAMAGYFASGSIAVIAFSRRGSIVWRQAGAICAGTVPGAFVGAVTVAHLPGLLVECVVAALTLFSGLNALQGRNRPEESGRDLGTSFLVVIGLLVGFGSAASGTGGPLLLVPVLMWLRVPILTALGAAHLCQVSIATCATVGNLLYAEIDVAVAAGLAVLLGAGVAIGVNLAHRIPTHVLRNYVAVALVITGLLLVFGVVRRLI